MLRVAFEDVRSHPGTVLAEVQAFLGLDPADLSAPPSNTSFPTGPRPELAPVDVFWMNRIAGRAIRRAGYRLRPSGASPLAVLRSALALPGWMNRQGGRGGLSVGALLRWFR